MFSLYKWIRRDDLIPPFERHIEVSAARHLCIELCPLPLILSFWIQKILTFSEWWEIETHQHAIIINPCFFRLPASSFLYLLKPKTAIDRQLQITPWKINGWNLQITYLERKMIFQTFMIMFHVNLPGVYQSCLTSPSPEDVRRAASVNIQRFEDVEVEEEMKWL